MERSPFARGVVTTLEWIRGERDGPVTGRADRPVTAPLARAEMGPLTRSSIPTHHCRYGHWPTSSVPHRRPLPIAPHAAEGVHLTPRRLVGDTAEPPLILPARHTEGDLVQATMAAAPHRFWGPEERHAARTAARDALAQSQRLLKRITAIQTQIASA